MIKITNKHSTFISVEGNVIPPFKSIEIEMPRTPSIRSLERNGIIAISEMKEPSTNEILEYNEVEKIDSIEDKNIELEESKESEKNETNEKSSKKRKKN